MKSRAAKQARILVIDLGGSNIQCIANGHMKPLKLKSGPKLAPDSMVLGVLRATHGWNFESLARLSGCGTVGVDCA
jgi:hypothetical protein